MIKQQRIIGLVDCHITLNHLDCQVAEITFGDDMLEKPYIDSKISAKEYIRLFSNDINPDSLVWHRDIEDRLVTVLEGRKWLLQFENPRKNYYNKLILAAPFGKCPLCSVREVDTLDHYLPKSKYPIYAVTPINLIPSCFKCNKGKFISFPTKSEEQTLNPYYDNIESEEWINAEVLQTSPISFRYFVNSPILWNQPLKDRVSNHFDSYHINELFSSHANEELRGVKKQLENLYNDNPSLLVSHLQDSYISRIELGMNSWQALMYKALLNDDWFCSGGVLTN